MTVNMTQHAGTPEQGVTDLSGTALERVPMTSEEEDYLCRQGIYRHEFECWASGTHLYKDISRCPNGLYAAQRTQSAWDGWVSCLLQERRS